MASHLMDNIAKALAGQVPRRQALKIISAGIGGIILSSLGAKTALAGDACAASTECDGGIAEHPEIKGRCCFNIPGANYCCKANEYCPQTGSTCVVTCASGRICGGTCCTNNGTCTGTTGTDCPA
jgi:hypothetical protein